MSIWRERSLGMQQEQNVSPIERYTSHSLLGRGVGACKFTVTLVQVNRSLPLVTKQEKKGLYFYNSEGCIFCIALIYVFNIFL